MGHAHTVIAPGPVHGWLKIGAIWLACFQAGDAMAETELRWHQRLESLQRALAQLRAALKALAADPANEVIGIAVIKAYEFSFELSWKTLKDLLNHGGIDVLMPREVLRQAFANGLLQDGQLWIDMLEQRNLMAHTVDVKRARQALALIQEQFAPALLDLAADLERQR
jgi:nucleotidyltransferase substrate binding protein (TIGR01987 family)